MNLARARIWLIVLEKSLLRTAGNLQTLTSPANLRGKEVGTGPGKNIARKESPTGFQFDSTSLGVYREYIDTQGRDMKLALILINLLLSSCSLVKVMGATTSWGRLTQILDMQIYCGEGKMKALHIMALLIGAIYVCPASAEVQPWSHEIKCNLQSANSEGIYPNAISALSELALLHRITQGLNTSLSGDNYHRPDSTVDGREYTSAVDISVRCLNQNHIRLLLSALADKGFSAWYRSPGSDGWPLINKKTGKVNRSHIHAVWVGNHLKEQLRSQVNSWLQGKNGLVSNQTYKFWQPSSEQKQFIKTQYQAENQGI